MAGNMKRTFAQLQNNLADKRMRNAGKKNKKFAAPSCITVQRLSETPNRSKKYEPRDTRDFIDFTDYDDLTTENIKDSCEKHYEMPQGSCDILLTDRGLSCFLTEQIAGKSFTISILHPT